MSIDIETRLYSIEQSLAAVTRYGAGEIVFNHQQPGIVDPAQKALTDFLTATNAALITPSAQRLIEEFNFVRGDVPRTALEAFSPANRPIAEIDDERLIHITPDGMVIDSQQTNVGTGPINKQDIKNLLKILNKGDVRQFSVQEGIIEGENGSQVRAYVVKRPLEARDLNTQYSVYKFTRGFQLFCANLESAASRDAAKNTFGTSDADLIVKRTSAFREAAELISASLR
jgi:hypothetical protein